MMEVLEWLHKMLGGSSPQTGYVGSLGIIVSLIDLISGHVQSAIGEVGAPTNKLEWIILIMSIGLRLAKDANRTNSQHPLASAEIAPHVSAPK